MNMYGECPICGATEDLLKWRKIDWVCYECFRYLSMRAPYVNGLGLNNHSAYLCMAEEIRDAKGKTRA